MTATPIPRKKSEANAAPSISSSELERAVQDHFLHLFRAARGAGLDQDEAEEITQETFATLLEAADDFEGRSQLRTYLFGILYNKLREHRRWLGKQRRYDSIDGDGADRGAGDLDLLAGRFDDRGFWLHPPQGPEAFTSARETRQLIDDCMESAPPAQRMAFQLREVEGLDSEEICKILGVSSTNLGVMMHRFRNRVRNCLEAQGVGPDHSGGRVDAHKLETQEAS